MVKNPPANAGDTGSILGPRRVPHAMDQLSPGATTKTPCSQKIKIKRYSRIMAAPLDSTDIDRFQHHREFCLTAALCTGLF